MDRVPEGIYGAQVALQGLDEGETGRARPLQSYRWPLSLGRSAPTGSGRVAAGRRWASPDCRGERALARQGKPNHLLNGQEIDTHTRPEEAALRFLDAAAVRLGWSARHAIALLRP